MPFSDIFGGSIASPSVSGTVPFDLVGGIVSQTGSASLAIDSSGSIDIRVGSTQSVVIICNQIVTSTPLLFTVETKAKVDVAEVEDADISREEYEATLSLTNVMTASERTLRWSLTKVSNGEAVANGLMFVTYDAQGDT